MSRDLGTVVRTDHLVAVRERERERRAYMFLKHPNTRRSCFQFHVLGSFLPCYEFTCGLSLPPFRKWSQNSGLLSIIINVMTLAGITMVSSIHNDGASQPKLLNSGSFIFRKEFSLLVTAGSSCVEGYTCSLSV